MFVETKFSGKSMLGLKLTDDTTENNDVMNDDSFEESLGNLPDLTKKFQNIQVIPNSVKVLWDQNQPGGPGAGCLWGQGACDFGAYSFALSWEGYKSCFLPDGLGEFSVSFPMVINIKIRGCLL